MMLKAIKDKPSDPIDFMSSLFLVYVETGLWKGKDSAPYCPPCPKSMVLFLFQCAAAKVSLGISIMLNDWGKDDLQHFCPHFITRGSYMATCNFKSV